MLLGVAMAIGSVLVVLACSVYQLYSSRVENHENQIDRKQMFLILIVLLDIPCVFLPLLMAVLAPAYIYAMAMPMIVILGGVIPVFIGSWVALRKGPIRISLPLACFVLVVIASFEYWTFWILPRVALRGW